MLKSVGWCAAATDDVDVLSVAGGRCLDIACSSSFTAFGSLAAGLLSLPLPFVFGGLGGNVD